LRNCGHGHCPGVEGGASGVMREAARIGVRALAVRSGRASLPAHGRASNLRNGTPEAR